MENTSALQKGEMIVYNGLGGDRAGIITKKTKQSVTIKLQFSTVKISYKGEPLIEEIGLRKIKQ